MVANCGIAPIARNMMLKKDTPKNDRAPVAVLAILANRDPMMRDMMTTWISLAMTRALSRRAKVHCRCNTTLSALDQVSAYSWVVRASGLEYSLQYIKKVT